jgi:hypothetical protein
MSLTIDNGFNSNGTSPNYPLVKVTTKHTNSDMVGSLDEKYYPYL